MVNDAVNAAAATRGPQRRGFFGKGRGGPRSRYWIVQTVLYKTRLENTLLQIVTKTLRHMSVPVRVRAPLRVNCALATRGYDGSLSLSLSLSLLFSLKCGSAAFLGTTLSGWSGEDRAAVVARRGASCPLRSGCDA
jgi:hypothetical protein